MSDQSEALEKQKKTEALIQRALGDEAVPCPQCGEILFVVTPGKKSKEAIQQFAAASTRYQTNKEALSGWIHPGIYCPRGCTEIFLEFGRN